MTEGTEGRPGGGIRAFSVHTESSEAVDRVRLLGEMDLSVIGEVDSEMRRAEATSVGRIELDLDQLEFLDAAGVRLLLRLSRRSLGNGGRLRIRPASSAQVRRVLELTGVGAELPLEAA